MVFKKKKSPGQQLRERIQKRTKPLGREALSFHGRVISIATAEFHSDAHCDAWHDCLYEDYVSDGSPVDRESWIRTRLQSEFVWTDSPPDWGREEPEWPFWDDRPMVFLHQFGLPENPVTREHATWDAVLYVFGIRIPRPNGYEMEYKVVPRHVRLQTVGEHYQEEEGSPQQPAPR